MDIVLDDGGRAFRDVNVVLNHNWFAFLLRRGCVLYFDIDRFLVEGDAEAGRLRCGLGGHEGIEFGSELLHVFGVLVVGGLLSGKVCG